MMTEIDKKLLDQEPVKMMIDEIKETAEEETTEEEESIEEDEPVENAVEEIAEDMEQ